MKLFQQPPAKQPGSSPSEMTALKFFHIVNLHEIMKSNLLLFQGITVNQSMSVRFGQRVFGRNDHFMCCECGPGIRWSYISAMLFPSVCWFENPRAWALIEYDFAGSI